ncbi:hypothetical protein [Chryseobacterium joostei]|uniref:hypothetical protein n=1 Tax=Chryseobacterium joostei TaxID=112234 RepID=UPI003D12046F
MQRKTISTNSGMWILWDYSAFNNINDYGDWAEIFEEEIDIIEQIKQRKIVPININSDGVFDFEVKLNEKLDDREKKYVLVSSSDYVINSMGKLVL